MLRRLAFLALALWFSAGSLAFAATRPCHEAAPAAAAVELAHAHCDMMAEPASSQPDGPLDAPTLHPACCCPGIAPAVILPVLSGPSVLVLTDAGGPLTDISAPSRALIPEPPPPKA